MRYADQIEISHHHLFLGTSGHQELSQQQINLFDLQGVFLNML